MENYLHEAFKAFNELNEEVFDVSTTVGFEDAKEFDEMPVDDREEEIIIDPLAADEEELEKDYVGKAILQCEICQSMIYKDPSEVVIDEEAGLANMDEACPFCQSEEGFKVIGQVEEFCDDECEEHEEEKEESSEEEIEEEPKEEVEETEEETKIEESLEDEEEFNAYDRRAVERDYDLEDGELDGVDIRRAEEMIGEEDGALDRYIFAFQDDEDVVGESIRTRKSVRLKEDKKSLSERNLTRAERHNRDMDRIFNFTNNQNKQMAQFLLDNGVSAEEVEELKSHTGLGKNALDDKLTELGIRDEFFKKYYKSESKSRDDIDADADDKKERARKRFTKAEDDADADRDYKLKRKGLKEAQDVTDQVIINTNEDGYLTKKRELEAKGYKRLWTGDGKICMAKSKRIKEDLEDQKEVHVFEQEDPSWSDISWYFEDDGLNGKDGGYGLFIIGNNDYKPFLYTGKYNEKPIRDAYEESDDDKEFIAKLKEITGKDYARYSLTGYSQSDWQDAYYPVDEFSKEWLDEISDAYFGNFSRFYDTTEEVGGYIVFDSDRRNIKEILSEQSGVPVENIKVRKITGYHTVPDYMEESCNTKKSKKSLKESDKPAAISIEDAQKWVDYDMKRYGKISDRTNRLVKKAGFQILKDDHGDYEVAAGKFESFSGTDMRAFNKVKEYIKNAKSTENFYQDIRDILADSFIEDWDIKTLQRLADAKFDELEKGDNIKHESLKEDFNKVDIETDREKMTMTAEPDGKVTVTTEPKTEEEIEVKEKEEVIEPVSDETKAEFKSTNDQEEVEYDFDEFEERDFDELGEGFLKKVYENVKSFKTTSGAINGNKLKLEGLITFKSGKQAKTNFVFESYKATKTGKLKFIGENKQFARGKKSFTLTGKADGKKLVCESLNYNYRAKTNDGKSKYLYGTIRK